MYSERKAKLIAGNLGDIEEKTLCRGRKRLSCAISERQWELPYWKLKSMIYFK